MNDKRFWGRRAPAACRSLRPQNAAFGPARLAFAALVALSLACRTVPTPPPLVQTPLAWATAAAVTADAAATAASAAMAAPGSSAPGITPTAAVTLVPPTISSAPILPNLAGLPGSPIMPLDWQPGPLASAADVALPADYSRIRNPQILDGLTFQQRERLLVDGFVVLRTQETQFFAIRERVAWRYGQPYYLTTDHASQALALTLAELYRALEQEVLAPRLLLLTRATLAEVLAAAPQVQGGPLEADLNLAAAYLGVGLRLIDAQAELDPAIAAAVEAQVAQIMAGGGEQPLSLLPAMRDDLSSYQPNGYYAGDPQLASYFRARRWFGGPLLRYQPANDETPSSRAPLIVTQALRRASLDGAPAGSAAEAYAAIRQALAFYSGPDVLGGPLETAAWMDQIYGPNPSWVDLAEARRWELFLSYVRAQPLPNPQPGYTTLYTQGAGLAGWRFLGYGFQPDAFILQSLADNRSGQPWPPQRLPSGLDVMAALGAPAALAHLEAGGMIALPPYYDLNRALLRRAPDAWLATLPEAWLFTFAAQVQAHSAAYPQPMRRPNWAIKDLNSALGVWAGQRHAHPALTAVAPADSDAPRSAAAPAYLEADPLTFYRLSAVAYNAVDLLRRNALEGVFSVDPGPQSLAQLMQAALDLGDRLQRLGDLAAGQLAGQALGPDDWALLQAPLGVVESWAAASPYRADLMPTPAGIIRLSIPNHPPAHAAAGGIDRLYVLQPDGENLVVAQGGVYSYYEFPIPSAGALDDEAWSYMLRQAPPAVPGWAQTLYLPDGNPIDWLAFHPGDVLRVTISAGRLNMRQEPGRFEKSIYTLTAGQTLTLLEGPHMQDGMIWWRARFDGGGAPVEGWVVEDQTWYERLW